MTNMHPDNKNSNSPLPYSVTVDVESVGLRLDKFLVEKLPQFSRSRLKSLVESGFVQNQTNEMVAPDVSHKVKLGEIYSVVEPPSISDTPKAQEIKLDIIFEDSDLIVVNKPAGMVVHPANGHEDGTLVNALLFHARDSLSGIGGVKRPGIVHRIDKDTSGLLVVAKNDATHKGLSVLFHDHDIIRSYHALIKGRINPPMGTIEGNIARHPQNRKKMAVSEGRGRSAITHYKTEQVFTLNEQPFASHVICTLETGRTHQVRVHLTHKGHPLIGDPVYARKMALPQKASPELLEALSHFNRQALHAAILGFKHPITGEALYFEAPLPKDMKNLINLMSKA